MCGAYALERWLGLNLFLSFRGAPVVVDVFIPTATAEPSIFFLLKELKYILYAHLFDLMEG